MDQDIMDNGQLLQIGDGIELAVTDCGRGEVIVFISGFAFASDVFQHQLEALAENNRVILIEPRSHGRSPHVLEGNHYPQHGQDLDKVFSKLNLQKISLVGWSFGALSAWSYINYAGLDRLHKFVCIDMPPQPLSAGEAQGDWVEAPVAEIAALYHNLLNFEGYKAFISDYTKQVMLKGEWPAQDYEHFLSAPLQTPLPIIRDLFVSGIMSNYLDIAKQIDRERASLFFIAEHWADIAVPYLNKQLPNARIEVFGGHMMFWEYAARFNKILQQFLDA